MVFKRKKSHWVQTGPNGRPKLYKKKSDAKKKAQMWRDKGYNARVKRGSTQVGTSKKSKVKGWKVMRDMSSYNFKKDKSRHT